MVIKGIKITQATLQAVSNPMQASVPWHKKVSVQARGHWNYLNMRLCIYIYIYICVYIRVIFQCALEKVTFTGGAHQIYINIYIFRIVHEQPTMFSWIPPINSQPLSAGPKQRNASPTEVPSNRQTGNRASKETPKHALII